MSSRSRSPQSLWSVVAAILHLGDIGYAGDGHGMAKFVDTTRADNVAKVTVRNTKDPTPHLLTLHS